MTVAINGQSGLFLMRDAAPVRQWVIDLLPGMSADSSRRIFSSVEAFDGYIAQVRLHPCYRVTFSTPFHAVIVRACE